MARDFLARLDRSNYESLESFEALEQQEGAYGEQEGAYGEQEGAYGEQEGAYGEQEGAYGEQEGAYGEQEGPYGEREGSYGEQEGPYGEQEGAYGEQEGQYEAGFGSEAEQEAEGVLDETAEMELAAELLSLNNERELDRLIGKLIRSACRAVGGVVSRDVGSALGGSIKAAARQVLPTLGGAATAEVGELFGVEMEGLSGEDQDFESARRFVRFAGAASGRAARLSRRADPRSVAKRAMTAASRRWAPGLLRGSRFWHRRQRDWRGRDHRRRPGGPDMRPPTAPGPGYPYPAPYPSAAIPGAPGPEQPGSGFDPNAAAGGGFAAGGSGAPAPSGGAGADQGMPDFGAGQDAGGGSPGPLPPSGRWTRQGGQLILYL